MAFFGVILICAHEDLLIGSGSNNVPIIEHVNVRFLTDPFHLVVCTEA